MHVGGSLFLSALPACLFAYLFACLRIRLRVFPPVYVFVNAQSSFLVRFPTVLSSDLFIWSVRVRVCARACNSVRVCGCGRRVLPRLRFHFVLYHSLLLS